MSLIHMLAYNIDDRQPVIMPVLVSSLYSSLPFRLALFSRPIRKHYQRNLVVR